MIERTGERVALRGSRQTLTFAVVNDGREDLVQIPLEHTQEDLSLRRMAMDVGRFDRAELSYLIPVDKWNERVTIDGQYRS
jgi:hypothetical protein